MAEDILFLARTFLAPLLRPRNHAPPDPRPCMTSCINSAVKSSMVRGRIEEKQISLRAATLLRSLFNIFLVLTFFFERDKLDRLKERVRGRKVMLVNAAMRLIVCGVHRRAVIYF